MNGLEAALLIAVTIAAIAVRHALYGERQSEVDDCYVERDWQWPVLDPRYNYERRERRHADALAALLDEAERSVANDITRGAL